MNIIEFNEWLKSRTSENEPDFIIDCINNYGTTFYRVYDKDGVFVGDIPEYRDCSDTWTSMERSLEDARIYLTSQIEMYCGVDSKIKINHIN